MATATGTRTVLILTNAELGQANVALAVAHELATTHGIQVHLASFDALASTVEAVSRGLVACAARAATVPPLIFHPLGPWHYGDIMARFMALHARPLTVLNALTCLKFNMQMAALPWEADELATIHASMLEVVNSVRPDFTLVDNLLTPALSMAAQLDLAHAVLSPNSVKDYLGLVGGSGGGWKGIVGMCRWPMSNTALPCPVPAHLVPLNILIGSWLVVCMLSDRRRRRIRRELWERYGVRMVNFIDFARQNVTGDGEGKRQFITACRREVDFPGLVGDGEDALPRGLSCVGPIIRPATGVGGDGGDVDDIADDKIDDKIDDRIDDETNNKTIDDTNAKTNAKINDNGKTNDKTDNDISDHDNRHIIGNAENNNNKDNGRGATKDTTMAWLHTPATRTIYVNLGSHRYCHLSEAMAMARALNKGLLTSSSDTQVLWKLRPDPATLPYDTGPGSELHAALVAGVHHASRRVRVLSWIGPEPSAILATGRVVLTVHHGGANSYYEAICHGVPQVILPSWTDCYDNAHRVEALGVGRWGSRRAKPSWAADELSAALEDVMSRIDHLRERAASLARVCGGESGGRVAAAEEVMRLMRAAAGVRKDEPIALENGGAGLSKI